MSPHFLFVAAENDGIANCKAGGMADVVRDVPREIAKNDHRVSVITPSYGRLQKAARFVKEFEIEFRGLPTIVQLLEAEAKEKHENITHYILHHPNITSGSIAQIYHHDAEEPFATDADKFALFCKAVATLIKDASFGVIDCVHLHDWHTTLILALREFDKNFESLKSIRFVYTIHNLALQGIRPITNNSSSLKAWFPEMNFDIKIIQDPRYTDCINLMAVGIRLADAVHTVSPSYKKDILMPSEPPIFIGGEGLEADLRVADKKGKLHGILNGISYDEKKSKSEKSLLETCMIAVFDWITTEQKHQKSEFLNHTGKKLIHLLSSQPTFLATSVARLTDQKFYFFLKYPEMLDRILEKLATVKGAYVLLGTGAEEYEELFREMSYKHANFVFINGQSDEVVSALYSEANLYLMPSLFEPCGISQMLAMRCGQPCLAHRTGGLRDTVGHLINGFCFDGKSIYDKANNMVEVFEEALHLFFENPPEEWKEIAQNALDARFEWSTSVSDYYRYLYNIELSPNTNFQNQEKSSYSVLNN
ncbi:MAG: glycogen synthase [Bacteroidetes bacterium HGW-Bacteroidetes-13]|nr:MAG: glycogen synthase [Bacteroidetes bacterium HGW-Bacteroidetes-13]